MNDRRNKWIMFSKGLERNKKREYWGGTQERVDTLAEANPAVPGTVAEEGS